MKNKIRSYKESYLSDSMPNLGDFFDFAIHAHGKSSEDVWREFATSWLAVEYGRGSPKYVAGLSGLELYYALYKTDDWDIASKAAKSLRLNTPEFWCGWILAYYQWAYNMTFKTIQSRLPFEKLLSLYSPLHQMDESRAAEILHERLTRGFPTNLSVIRKARELKQADLAYLSGVSLRSIQMYEQRNKDINKAQAESLHALARTLSCTIEDLLEI